MTQGDLDRNGKKVVHKPTRGLKFSLLALIMIVILAGCGASPAKENANNGGDTTKTAEGNSGAATGGESYEVTHAMGTETIKGTPQRLSSLRTKEPRRFSHWA